MAYLHITLAVEVIINCLYAVYPFTRKLVAKVYYISGRLVIFFGYCGLYRFRLRFALYVIYYRFRYKPPLNRIRKSLSGGVNRINSAAQAATAAALLIYFIIRLFFFLIGFYAVECGNVLGLGGAFFAALCAVGILSKEDKDKTAEFLLTHPVSRKRVVTEKLIAVLIQITAMNIIIYALAVGSIAAIGAVIGIGGVITSYLKYTKKDIH